MFTGLCKVIFLIGAFPCSTWKLCRTCYNKSLVILWTRHLVLKCNLYSLFTSKVEGRSFVQSFFVTQEYREKQLCDKGSGFDPQIIKFLDIIPITKILTNSEDKIKHWRRILQMNNLKAFQPKQVYIPCLKNNSIRIVCSFNWHWNVSNFFGNSASSALSLITKVLRELI